MVPRVPPQLAEMATRWLTERLVENRVFVNAVQSGHRFYRDVKDGLVDGLQERSPDRTPETARDDHLHRSTASEQPERTYRHRPTRSAAPERPDPSSREPPRPPEDDTAAKLNELLEKMRSGKP